MYNFQKNFIAFCLTCLFLILLSSTQLWAYTYASGNNTSAATWTNFQDDFSFHESYIVDSIIPSPDNWGKVYVSPYQHSDALLLADYSTGLLTELLPQIKSVTIDPNNSQHMFAIGMFTIYESFDGGDSWDTISDANTFGYSVTQIDPSVRYLQYSPDGNVIYCYCQRAGTLIGSPGWLFASSIDNGRTWRAPTGLQKGSGVGPIAASNSKPNIVFARIQEKLYKSIDYGLHWQFVASLVANSNVNGDLAIDPFDENIIYAINYTFDNSISDHAAMNLFKTIDGGTTWDQISFPNYSNYKNYAINANQYTKGLIYIGIESSNPRDTRILRSIDSGQTWSSLNNLVNSGLGANLGSITYLISGPLQSDGSVILYASANNDKGIYRYVDYPFNQQTLRASDLTGNWLFLNEICKNTKKGIKCNIKSKLTIQNMGTRDAASSVVRFYLSDNDVYDAGDIFLKKVSTGKLKVGKSTNKAFAFNFKIGISATGKYVIAVLDADNKVAEAGEGNNSIVYGPIP